MSIRVNGTKYFLAIEVAELVGVTRQTLWRWRRAGDIPIGSRYRGRQILYTDEEVELIRQFSERIEPIASSTRRQKTLFESRQ